MNTSKELFYAAFTGTIVVILVVIIPWIFSGFTNAFHIIGALIVAGLWIAYLVVKNKEKSEKVVVVVQNIESQLLGELISYSKIDASIKDFRHNNNMENWEIVLTQRDYEKLCDYMSKYSSRYRGRIWKKEE